MFLFKAWLSFQTAESVLVGLFVSSKTCISFLNHPPQPYMLLKNVTGLSWRETQEKQEREKLLQELLTFSVLSPSFHSSVCVFSGASCLQRSLIGYPPAYLSLVRSFFLGRRNEPLAVCRCVRSAARCRSRDGSHLTRCP